MSKSLTRPRRRIERIRNTLQATYTTTQVDDVLHTVEDTKTLIRAYMDIRMYVSTTGTVRGELVLHVAPGGTAVVTPSVTEQLDQDPPLQEILRVPVLCLLDTTVGYAVTEHIKLDTKAMRKLKPGDTIVLSGDMNGSTVVAQGVIYLWFKE